MRILVRLLLFGMAVAAWGLLHERPRRIEIPPGARGPALDPGVAEPRDSLGPPATGTLDLNRAERAQLESLPGIGPALAGRILDYRRARGGFRHARELLLVGGIGPRKWAALRGLVGPP